MADSLRRRSPSSGLGSFGERGEPFDPTMHEALTHGYSAEVTEDTCVEIFQPGYRVGERILRPARVAVAEPRYAGRTEAPTPADMAIRRRQRTD